MVAGQRAASALLLGHIELHLKVLSFIKLINLLQDLGEDSIGTHIVELSQCSVHALGILDADRSRLVSLVDTLGLLVEDDVVQYGWVDVH